MSVQVSVSNEALIVPYRTDAAQLLPHAKPIAHNGQRFLVVPHGHDEVRLLNNLGVHAPAPVLYHYDWSGDTPFASQKETAALLTTSKRAYVLSEMGVGKTRAVLYATDFLMHKGSIDKALIVAPLSTLTPVWHSEIFRYFPHRSSVVLHGTRARRLKLLNDPDFDFYIINPDALQIIEPEIKSRTDINLVVFDELTAFRTKTTRRWKYAWAICKDRDYVWGLTGSPTPNAPTDAYGQVRLLTPSRVPNSFKRFRESTMLQVTQFKWVPRREGNDIVREAMRPCVRFTRDECFDLPPVSTVERAATMSATQQKFYDSMRNHLRADYKNHQITAANEGVKLNKLLQIIGGYVYTNNKDVLSLSPTARLQAVEDVIAEAARKVIVFAPFKHTVWQVHEHLQSSRHEVVGMVTGDTPKKVRDVLFNEFQNSVYPKILVGHPQCLSHGLTLTAADTIVWYLPTDSNEIYEQAVARISRAGQKHPQLIVHIAATAVERRVYKRLQNKQQVQGALLDMFESVDEGL